MKRAANKGLLGCAVAGLLVASAVACDDDGASSGVPDGGAVSDAAVAGGGGGGGPNVAFDAAAGGNPGDAAAAAPFASGLSPDKIIGQLTPAEAEKVCKAGGSFFAKRLTDPRVSDAVCRVTGLVTVYLLGANLPPAQAVLACFYAYSQCKNMPAPDAGAMVVMPPNMCGTPDPGCTLTVAEYEQCVNDIDARADKFVPTVPDCTQAGMSGVNALAAVMGLRDLASCPAAATKCPGLDLFGNVALPGNLPGR